MNGNGTGVNPLGDFRFLNITPVSVTGFFFPTGLFTMAQDNNYISVAQCSVSQFLLIVSQALSLPMMC